MLQARPRTPRDARLVDPLPRVLRGLDSTDSRACAVCRDPRQTRPSGVGVSEWATWRDPTYHVKQRRESPDPQVRVVQLREDVQFELQLLQRRADDAVYAARNRAGEPDWKRYPQKALYRDGMRYRAVMGPSAAETRHRAEVWTQRANDAVNLANDVRESSDEERLCGAIGAIRRLLRADVD